MTRDEAATVILTRVIAREGGIADVGDGSGLTRFGQTPAWLRTFGFAPPTTADEALANYQTWLVRTRLIGLCDAPDVLADAVIDWAVNAGHTTAIAALQRALGVHVDGILGPETQAAIERADRRRIGARVVAAKVRFRGVLIAGNPANYAKFARGWLTRDAEQIEALGA